MAYSTLNENGPLRVLRNVQVGEQAIIYNFVNAYECTIGRDSRVGSFVEIQRGVLIGERCKIQSHSFICEGVEIGDETFVGHGVNFINDKNPRATNPDGTLQTTADWKVVKTKIGKGVSIGTGAIIMCGITIGDYAQIGAGSVVTKDVKSKEVVAGVPARVISKSTWEDL